MPNLSTHLYSTLAAAKRRLEGWAWLAVITKLGLWAIAFVALAHIGTGTAARLLGAVPLSPTAHYGAHQLEAVDLELPGGPPSGSSADSATRPPCRRRDGGAPPDGDGGTGNGGATTADGRLILNQAAASDLVALPGIGPKRAQAILELRSRLKGFKRIEDLLRVRGIGRRSLRRLRPLVVVDPPRDH